MKDAKTVRKVCPGVLAVAISTYQFDELVGERGINNKYGVAEWHCGWTMNGLALT